MKIWAALETVQKSGFDDLAPFNQGRLSATRTAALVSFLEALCLIEKNDYAGANKLLEDALSKWPGNFEFVFAKMVCLRATGSDDQRVDAIIEKAAQDNTPYIQALVGAFNGDGTVKVIEVSKERSAFLAWLREQFPAKPQKQSVSVSIDAEVSPESRQDKSMEGGRGDGKR